MKILLIDDNPGNLEAARDQLNEHEFTLCSSYRAGASKLNHDPILSDHKYSGFSFKKGEPQFDMVLTDLFLPTTLIGTGGSDFEHQQPYGLVLAFTALRRGIKKIAIISNAGHHDHPIIWAMDSLGEGFSVGETKFIFSQRLIWEGEKGWQKSWAENATRGSNGINVKNWKVVADELQNQE